MQPDPPLNLVRRAGFVYLQGIAQESTLHFARHLGGFGSKSYSQIGLSAPIKQASTELFIFGWVTVICAGELIGTPVFRLVVERQGRPTKWTHWR